MELKPRQKRRTKITPSSSYDEIELCMAIIVGILSIDPSLLYVDSDPTDPVAVWKKFVPVPEEDMG